MSNRDRVAGIELENSTENTDLHLYPRETRRGKAQWGLWVRTDGSAILFVGNDQIVLPKNSSKNEQHIRNHVDGQIVYQKV